MVQQTLTRQIVHNACEELHAQMGEFTYKELHAHIGHGTMSNVHRWGREWLKQQEAPARFKTLPRGFTELIMSMAVSTWDAANKSLAAEDEAISTRLEREKAGLSERILELEGQFASALEDKERLEAEAALLVELEHQLEQEAARAGHLEENFAAAAAHHASEIDDLIEQKSALSDQIAKLQEVITDVSSERDRYQQDACAAMELSQKLEDSEKKLAASSAALQRAEQENAAAKTGFDALENTVHGLRIAVATGEAREAGLRDQVALLKAQLEWAQTNQKTASAE